MNMLIVFAIIVIASLFLVLMPKSSKQVAVNYRALIGIQPKPKPTGPPGPPTQMSIQPRLSPGTTNPTMRTAPTNLEQN